MSARASFYNAQADPLTRAADAYREAASRMRCEELVPFRHFPNPVEIVGTESAPATIPNRFTARSSGAFNAMTSLKGLLPLAITKGSPWQLGLRDGERVFDPRNSGV